MEAELLRKKLSTLRELVTAECDETCNPSLALFCSPLCEAVLTD